MFTSSENPTRVEENTMRMPLREASVEASHPAPPDLCTTLRTVPCDGSRTDYRREHLKQGAVTDYQRGDLKGREGALKGGRRYPTGREGRFKYP